MQVFRLPISSFPAHGDIPMSVEAMKSGALEFLTKPCAMTRSSKPYDRLLRKIPLVVKNRPGDPPCNNDIEP